MEPKAILCVHTIDTLTLSRVLLANNWFNARIVLVDQLGGEVQKNFYWGKGNSSSRRQGRSSIKHVCFKRVAFTIKDVILTDMLLMASYLIRE
jgi:hypothetical protein